MNPRRGLNTRTDWLTGRQLQSDLDLEPQPVFQSLPSGIQFPFSVESLTTKHTGTQECPREDPRGRITLHLLMSWEV
jgi:hypothetical protein